MSIYGTTFDCGDDDADNPGVVLIRDGGTNHYPSLETNRRGSISGADIPSWCVPGHSYDDVKHPPGYDEPGEWYRLACHALWPDADNRIADLQMLLDEDSARALRDDLTRWLELPKTRPVKRKKKKGKVLA